MAIIRRSFLLAFALLLSGCSKDIKQHADQIVLNEFLKAGTHVKAVPFFEEGGRYYEPETDASTSVDQKIILPMLKDLYAICPLAQWVVPDKENPKLAFALLVELPADNDKVDEMAKIVEAADAQFDGMILQQWGHTWLSVDLIDLETAEFFKKADPNFDKQR